MRLYASLKQDELQTSKPPEENGLSLSHCRFSIFTYLKYPWKLERKWAKTYELVQDHNGVTGFKQVQNYACKRTLRKRLYSQCRESRVRTEIRLQFIGQHLLYPGRLKAPHCFIQYKRFLRPVLVNTPEAKLSMI